MKKIAAKTNKIEDIHALLGFAVNETDAYRMRFCIHGIRDILCGMDSMSHMMVASELEVQVKEKILRLALDFGGEYSNPVLPVMIDDYMRIVEIVDVQEPLKERVSAKTTSAIVLHMQSLKGCADCDSYAEFMDTAEKLRTEYSDAENWYYRILLGCMAEYICDYAGEELATYIGDILPGYLLTWNLYCAVTSDKAAPLNTFFDRLLYVDEYEYSLAPANA